MKKKVQVIFFLFEPKRVTSLYVSDVSELVLLRSSFPYFSAVLTLFDNDALGRVNADRVIVFCFLLLLFFFKQARI